MRISIGLIFGLILLWSFILTSIYVVFRMVLIKESPGRGIVDLIEVSDNPSNATTATIIDKPLVPVTSIEAFFPSRKYAYVTLLHGIDTTFSYRGFLYNCLIVRKALEQLNTEADFIVLVGFTYGTDPNNARISADLKLMEKVGIKLHYLPRLADATDMPSKVHNSASAAAAANGSFGNGKQHQRKIPFLEMALLKITPWSFTEYERIQFFDGDVLPYRSMDCFFRLGLNTFNTGNASPLNSGWYLAVPNISDYVELRRKALQRMHSKKWDEERGWGTPIPPNRLYFRGGRKAVPKWSFNGASLDQGLLTDHFVLHEGRVQLIDTESAREPVKVYKGGFAYDVVSVATALKTCSPASEETKQSTRKGNGMLPTDYFHHYTGRNKPWLQDQRRPKDASQRLWAQHLDSLHLSVNSSSIHAQSLNSPLGYFYPNK